MRPPDRLSPMAPTVTLFEHEAVSYDDLGVHADGQFVGDLERVNTALGEDLVRLGRKQLRATQFVGVIRTGSLTLQVLPKIDYEGSSDLGGEALERAERSAAENLLRMLSYTRDLKVREQDVASLASRRSDWLEILTKLFARDLHAQMQRGMSRAYVRVEDTLPVMRGRWNVTRQLARNPHVRHLFDVAYDEFSEDTALNRVFKFTVELLINRTRGADTRRLLRDVHDWMLDVSSVSRVTPEDLDRAEMGLTRLNQQYRVPFNLARMFLENETLQLSSGLRDVYALVFDMNRLFEEFAARFVERHRDEILPIQWESARIETQSKERAVYLARRVADERDQFRLRPDLLFKSAQGETLLVADTKYKKLTIDGKKSISSGDVYQMLAYATRFECPRVLMLYPQQRGQSRKRYEYEIYGTQHSLFVATIDLHQPLDNASKLVAELKEIVHVATHDSVGRKVVHG